MSPLTSPLRDFRRKSIQQEPSKVKFNAPFAGDEPMKDHRLQ
jgi:hypothetical protein